MSQENQLPGTETLEARVTEYHIRKVIRNIRLRRDSGRHLSSAADIANFDLRRRSWKVRWRMSCVQGVTSIPTVPTWQGNLRPPSRGPSKGWRLCSASDAPPYFQLIQHTRTFCLINFAVGFSYYRILPFNGLRTIIPQPVPEAHKTPQKPSQELSEISHRGLSRAKCSHDDKGPNQDHYCAKPLQLHRG